MGIWLPGEGRVLIQRVRDFERVAERVARLRKIAAELGGGGHDAALRCARDLAQRFPGKEEERLVVAVVELGQEDGAGDGGAELILAQLGFGLIEKVSRVGQIVAHELVERSADAVAAGFADHAEHAAGEAAVLGIEARGDDLEFLNAFERRADHGGGVAPLRVVHAIDQEADVVGSRAVERVRAIGILSLRRDAAGEVDKIAEVAAVERHLSNLGVGGDIAARAALGVERGKRVRDGDALGHRADFEADVDAQLLIEQDGEFGAVVAAESGALRGHGITARSEVSDRVIARRICGGVGLAIGVEVDDPQLDAGDDGAAGISDTSDDGAGRILRI